MFPTLSARRSGLPRIPLAILLLTIAVVAGGQLLAADPAASDPTRSEPAGGDTAWPGVASDPLGPPVAGAGSSDLDRIRANASFWGARLQANQRDFVSATRLAASEVELARATGDLAAYLAADSAIAAALGAYPDYPIALDYRGVVDLALHRFVAARDHARTILAATPDDPIALATLGDAALESGDLRGAAGAYQTLSLVADSAAAQVRLSHLAFIEGRTDDAIARSRTAVERARDEGAAATALAWYEYQLGDTLIATGDRDGAAAAYREALAEDPTSHLARWGLARVAAADGDIAAAIDHLDAAIAKVPLPESLARRASLYDIRHTPGDEQRASDDRATVLAIARLAGHAAGVYDRTLALFLADTGIDPTRAVALASAELMVRKDVYGYDALAWALLADGRPMEADTEMTKALASGTRDAKLLYHQGMIKAALGDTIAARASLGAALALDPSFDPAGAIRARATLERLP